jgi:hypothetical protein
MRAAAVVIVRTLGERVLGREHPAIAVGLDELADDPLALSAGVVVGGVDEVAARLGVRVDDPRALLLRRSPVPLPPRRSSRRGTARRLAARSDREGGSACSTSRVTLDPGPGGRLVRSGGPGPYRRRA